MDAARLQGLIYAGYGRAGAKVGFSFDIYRPTDPLADPIQPQNKVGAVLAAFAVTGVDFNFRKPSNYKNPLYNGLYDGRLTQPGDYLVNASHGTYFVAQQQDLAPILCVQCNRVLSVAAAGPAKGFGKQDAYSGSTAANQQPVLSLWPGNILFDARGRSMEVGLPMDLQSPFFEVLLPPTMSADLRSGLVITDDQDRRYMISASERSALGWRLSAQQAVT